MVGGSLLVGLCLWTGIGLHAEEASGDLNGVAGVSRLEIHKAVRELWVFSTEERIATFPVGLGFAPEGHKSRQGDGTTPEGEYFVCIKNPHSQYYLSLGINYPNATDAVAALADGRVGDAEAKAIRQADRDRVCPLWNTDLGGEIFIHGRGSSSDWTLGCVALDDPDMKWLFTEVAVGTPVLIVP